MAPPLVESFTQLLTKSSNWFLQQNNARFLGCQSVEIPISKLDMASGLGEKREESLIDAENCEYLLKFIRICYAKAWPRSVHQRPSGDLPAMPSYRQEFLLNCKIFAPMRDNKIEVYESLESLKRKLEAWLRITGTTSAFLAISVSGN